MLSLKSTLLFTLGCASTALATMSDKGYKLAVKVPCTEDALDIRNSTAGAEDASLEKRDCSFSANLFAEGGCSYSGSTYGICPSGSIGCVLSNSVLPFGFNSIQVYSSACDLRIWTGGCGDGFSYGIPAGSGNGCWAGFGTAHGYSVQC